METEQFSGFGESIGASGKPAIIVVDFIKGFTDTNCPLGSDLDKEIDSTRQLLAAARQKDVPIIFTTVIYEPHFKDGAYFVEKIPALRCLTEESEWVEVDPRLERREQEEPLIVKKFASSFFGTSLQSILTYEKVETAIVVGCTTSGCVRATVVDAMQHGYKVLVPEDCVGDRSKKAHEANLYDMKTKYADVVRLESVLDYMNQLEGDTSHV
ncbi:isochorismatase family protein [Mesobacillus maritimus]|uniref:isochorismatase family protein n=1 Tax=Mesobacillus maritimus TaxID=1643336 RepID=UPI00203C78DE|nr:isochorismatase family protein [Mesobacillus maritimus]MCM3584982.1 isochorismatase family protein [Mesobacillus maritimus]